MSGALGIAILHCPIPLGDSALPVGTIMLDVGGSEEPLEVDDGSVQVDP